MVRFRGQWFKLFGIGVISAILTFPLNVLGTTLSPDVASASTTATPQVNAFQAVDKIDCE
jgi:hypothetical protein